MTNAERVERRKSTTAAARASAPSATLTRFAVAPRLPTSFATLRTKPSSAARTESTTTLSPEGARRRTTTRPERDSFEITGRNASWSAARPSGSTTPVASNTIASGVSTTSAVPATSRSGAPSEPRARTSP